MNQSPMFVIVPQAAVILNPNFAIFVDVCVVMALVARDGSEFFPRLSYSLKRMPVPYIDVIHRHRHDSVVFQLRYGHDIVDGESSFCSQRFKLHPQACLQWVHREQKH